MPSHTKLRVPSRFSLVIYLFILKPGITEHTMLLQLEGTYELPRYLVILQILIQLALGGLKNLHFQ